MKQKTVQARVCAFVVLMLAGSVALGMQSAGAVQEQGDVLGQAARSKSATLRFVRRELWQPVYADEDRRVVVLRLSNVSAWPIRVDTQSLILPHTEPISTSVLKLESGQCVFALVDGADAALCYWLEVRSDGITTDRALGYPREGGETMWIRPGTSVLVPVRESRLKGYDSLYFVYAYEWEIRRDQGSSRVEHRLYLDLNSLPTSERLDEADETSGAPPN